LALLCVGVVVAVVVGLVVWRGVSGSSGDPGDDGPSPTPDAARGSVGLLREKDPICDQWLKFGQELSDKEKQWAELDEAIPASQWTPEQLDIYSAVAQAMSTAADQYESILPMATHPVIQELGAQTIVYLRGYIERIPTYVEQDNALARVASGFDGALSFMCTAVPLTPAAGGGDKASAAEHPAELIPFMTTKAPVCDEYRALIDRQDSQLGGWHASDPKIPAAEWTPEQRKLNTAAQEVMNRDASQVREMAGRASNAILHDLLITQAEYLQAYADAIPTYIPDEHVLWRSATLLAGGLMTVCDGARP
jgi:hypothetical protein